MGGLCDRLDASQRVAWRWVQPLVKRSSVGVSGQVDPRLLRRGLLDNGYAELPITGEHAMAVLTLPPIHKDPFDRMLIAQAIAEGIELVTADDGRALSRADPAAIATGQQRIPTAPGR